MRANHLIQDMAIARHVANEGRASHRCQYVG